MIPKIIHYCWFGKNPMPEEYNKYIASWRKFNPDYKIVRWDEYNYDIYNTCEYVQQAYANKKWAFVSDYVRLDIIYKYGGFYFDTDVEILRSLDPLSSLQGFMGFENSEYVNSGLGIGSEKGNPLFFDFIQKYHSLNFVNKDKTFNLIPCPKIQTEQLRKYGLKINNRKQIIKGITIFPTSFFCPMNYYTGEIKITSDTYSIHHYSMSWKTKFEKKLKKIEWFCNPLIGQKFSHLFISFVLFPYLIVRKYKSLGFIRTIKYIKKKIFRDRGVRQETDTV